MKLKFISNSILIVVFLLSFQDLTAQIEWQNNLRDSSKFGTFFSRGKLFNSGKEAIVALNYEPYNAGAHQDFTCFIRFDSAGNEMWRTVFPDTNIHWSIKTHFHTEGLVVDNNKFYAFGKRWINSWLDHDNASLLKLDATGKLEWEFTPTLDTTSGSAILDLETTNNFIFLLVGQGTNPKVGPPYFSFQETFLFKLDKNGNEIDRKNIDSLMEFGTAKKFRIINDTLVLNGSNNKNKDSIFYNYYDQNLNKAKTIQTSLIIGNTFSKAGREYYWETENHYGTYQYYNTIGNDSIIFHYLNPKNKKIEFSFYSDFALYDENIKVWEVEENLIFYSGYYNKVTFGVRNFDSLETKYIKTDLPFFGEVDVLWFNQNKNYNTILARGKKDKRGLTFFIDELWLVSFDNNGNLLDTLAVDTHYNRGTSTFLDENSKHCLYYNGLSSREGFKRIILYNKFDLDNFIGLPFLAPEVQTNIFFPNPTTGLIQLKNTPNAIYILNIEGKLVYQTQNPTPIINLNLPNGLYFIQAQFEEGLKSQKLIIQNP